jgi:hypothetical protein
MAATALPDRTAANPHHAGIAPARHILGLAFCAGLPLGLFGLVNLGAEAMGVIPLFFSPFGMSGAAGAMVHLAQLALLGAAWWVLSRNAPKSQARHWLTGLTIAYIALPFITPPLDSLQLSLVSTSLFLLCLATLNRVGAASARAGWLLAPISIVLGTSAALGLILTAAYTPPFALTQDAQIQGTA